MTPIKIAVGYVRCSTDMQDDSIGQQKKSIESWAKANSYTIIGWFEDEGKSGTSFEKRPAFMRMVKRIESSPDFEHVLVYDESRWGRAGNPRESTYWKVHLERYGVKVRIINSQSKYENDIGSFVTEVVESAEASEYSKKLSRSTKRGCNARVERGWSAGGSAPYGYKRVAVHPVTGEFIRNLPAGIHRRKGEEVVKLEFGDPLEVRVVKRIFELASIGAGRRSIANTLNTEGVPCARRGKWKNKDQKWSGGTIRSIIQNPMYYGARVYNRHPKNKLTGLPRGKRNPSIEWIIREGSHPAIITKQLFDRANISRPSRFGTGSSRSIESPYLLSGLIKCSRCGFSYNGFTRKAKGLSYYADSGYISKGKAVCEWHAIPKGGLEDSVSQAIIENVVESDVPQRLEEMIQTYLDGMKSGVAGSFGALEVSLQENETKLQNLLSLAEEGIDLSTIIPRVKELEKKRQFLMDEIEKSSKLGGDAKALKSASQEAAKVILGFEKNLRSAPIREQKFLFRQFVNLIVVDRESEKVHCSLSRLPKTNNPVLNAMLQNRADLSLKGVPGTHNLIHS